MRFGTFVLPISTHPDRDSQTIDQTLDEASLVDELGFDAIWLTEHHFSGDCGYADPLVFAAAVALRTKRIKIGFAVLQMALHHPVRLAVQTALLDNLSHGRLIVGIGRGSKFNEYEYLGFGTTLEESKKSLKEAEELLIKAWTDKNVDFKGSNWNVSFPFLRPRPYQKPHPLLVRATGSAASVAEMASIGRPILTLPEPVDVLSKTLSNYAEGMRGAGFSEEQIENSLNETWVQRDLYVSDDVTAKEDAAEALALDLLHVRKSRERFNPAGEPGSVVTDEKLIKNEVSATLIAGTHNQVADSIAELRDVGARNLLLRMRPSSMSSEKAYKSIHCFAEKVAPLFKKD